MEPSLRVIFNILVCIYFLQKDKEKKKKKKKKLLKSTLTVFIIRILKVHRPLPSFIIYQIHAHIFVFSHALFSLRFLVNLFALVSRVLPMQISEKDVVWCNEAMTNQII
jgi:hypothetical protein